MADNIPRLDAPSVGPEPVRVPEASPAAFGAPLGAGLTAAGHEKADEAINQRHMNAAFDAQDRELKYGLAHDKLRESYENQIRTLNAPDTKSFQQQATALTVKFEQEQEKLRAQYETSLGDPLARKAYEVRTRLQAQNAAKTMGIFADAHVRAWRQAESTNGVKLDDEAAGNVSGILEHDLDTLELKRASTADKIALAHADGEPAEVARERMRQSDRTKAGNMLNAYDEKQNHAAAIEFLGKTLKDGTHIVYNPDDPPKDPSKPNYLLTTAEAQKFVNRVTAARTAKEGADLGEQLYQESQVTKGFDLEKRLTQLYNAGTSGEAIGKAREHFDTILSRHFTQHEHAVALNYDSAFKLVNDNYGGDIRQAILAADGGKDPQFRVLWNSLGAKQKNLKEALNKDSETDPAAYTALGAVINASNVPGGITKKWPSFEVFQAAMQGPLRGLWPEAVNMYKADAKRDTSQDVHYQIYKTETDERVRNATGWTHAKGQSGHGYWEEAAPDQHAQHLWVTLMSEKAWADHMQARKETPGKVSDVLWYRETLDQIMKAAQELKLKGQFKNGAVPNMRPTPQSATVIPHREVQYGRRLIDGVWQEQSGDRSVNNGWVPVKKEG
jgi:hypothetical protein